MVLIEQTLSVSAWIIQNCSHSFGWYSSTFIFKLIVLARRISQVASLREHRLQQSRADTNLNNSTIPCHFNFLMAMHHCLPDHITLRCLLGEELHVICMFNLPLPCERGGYWISQISITELMHLFSTFKMQVKGRVGFLFNQSSQHLHRKPGFSQSCIVCCRHYICKLVATTISSLGALIRCRNKRHCAWLKSPGPHQYGDEQSAYG